MATGRIGTTPVLTTRWTKEPSAGTTSLSGLDANSVSLVYSVGYEQVYRNGVLLSRGNDYTATNGTTITLTDATIAGDIIEVFANATVPLTDTYSQTVADGRFIKNTLTTTTGDIIYASAANTPARLGIGSTSQVLTVSGGVPTWAAPSGGMTLITSGNLGTNGVSLTSITGAYTDLYLYIYGVKFDTSAKYIGVWEGGSSASLKVTQLMNTTADTSTYIRFGTTQQYLSGVMALGILWKNYTNTSGRKPIFYAGSSNDGTNDNELVGGGIANTTSAITRLDVENAVGGGNITAGSYELWGIK